MRTREATIHAEESYAAAGTAVYPIRETSPISRILIPFGVTVGAAARLLHHSAAITKVEIVDGSDVLLSLDGPQLDGIARFDAHGSAGMWSSPTPSITEYGNLVIDFGRYLYDKELAFEPAKFKNPQLKITRSFTAVEATCTAVILAAHAYIMEGLGSSPRGFLMKKEMKSWTGVAAGWEYTQMARDFPYRRLFLQALTKLIGVGTHWSRARMSEDNDARIPFDVLVDDQIAKNARDYGDIVENVSGAKSTDAWPLFAAPAYGGAMNVNSSALVVALVCNSWNGGRFSVMGTAGTDPFRGIVHGLCPQGLVAFHMGASDEIEDWYDPKALGSLQLEVLGAGAYTMRLITEQLRPNVPR